MAGIKNIEKAKVLNLKDLISYKQNQVISLTICNTDDLRIVLFSFDKNEEITDEQTPNVEFFTLIEGKMKAKIDNQEFIMNADDSIIIDREKTHSFVAIEQSKILQTSLK